MTDQKILTLPMANYRIERYDNERPLKPTLEIRLVGDINNIGRNTVRVLEEIRGKLHSSAGILSPEYLFEITCDVYPIATKSMFCQYKTGSLVLEDGKLDLYMALIIQQE